MPRSASAPRRSPTSCASRTRSSASAPPTSRAGPISRSPAVMTARPISTATSAASPAAPRASSRPRCCPTAAASRGKIHPRPVVLAVLTSLQAHAMEEAAMAVPNIFPCFRYEDAPKAIDWLNKAFGFEKQFVVPGDNNTVVHAQLRFGVGMIMMGSGGQPDPNNPWSAALYGTYVVVEDIDAHFARAKAAGARSEEHTSELQSPCNLVCRL